MNRAQLVGATPARITYYRTGGGEGMAKPKGHRKACRCVVCAKRRAKRGK